MGDCGLAPAGLFEQVPKILISRELSLLNRLPKAYRIVRSLFSGGGQMEDGQKGQRDLLTEAAAHLRLALQLLDAADAPAHIGAHVDLAAHQLETEIIEPLSVGVASAVSRYGQPLQ